MENLATKHLFYGVRPPILSPKSSNKKLKTEGKIQMEKLT
jgi:hypothetical protein